MLLLCLILCLFLKNLIEIPHFSKKILAISLLNIILSLPFFLYLFYLDVNFIFNNEAHDLNYNFFSLENLSNKLIIIISIILFYLFPFILTNLNKIRFNLSKLPPSFILTSLAFFFILYFFDFSTSYEYTNSGGGFFTIYQIYYFRIIFFYLL